MEKANSFAGYVFGGLGWLFVLGSIPFAWDGAWMMAVYLVLIGIFFLNV